MIMCEVTTYSKEYNAFSRKLLEKFYASRRDQNLIFSPFSILMMLAIAADATAGNTRDEIAGVLSSEMNYEETLSVLKEIQKAFAEDAAFSSANAVCVNNKIEKSIVPTYAAHIQEQFGGELFSSSDIVSDVNAWVKKNTRGMIDKVADDSMRNMLACLMNATAFDGKWTKHYTRNDIDYKEFHNSDGTIKETAMLDISEREYVENDSFTGFVKPYKDVGFSFMALLPKKKSAAGMRLAMHSLDFSELFSSRTGERVVVALPEFKYSSGEDLTSYCKELGIEELFTDHADFTPLSSEWLKMAAIIHKARIEVDRHGTKAAAVTMGIVCAGAAPRFDYKIVELDRPFVYAIMHNETGLPVFTGVVNML